MQVDQLRLNGLRNHNHTTVNLANVNLFVGLNGAGKSSIKMSLEYLLTGRVTGITDEAGRGLDDLIGDDHASFEVSADIVDPDLGRVTRTPATGLAVPALSGPSSAQELVFYDRIGASREVITACLNTSRFLSFPVNEQKNMLFRLMGMEFDRDKLNEHVKLFAEDRPKSDKCIPESIIAAFRQFCPNGIAGGAEVFDQLSKIFTEQRKLAKKRLADLKLADKNAPQGEPLPPGVWEAREQIPAQLADLKAQRDKLIEQLGREKAQAEAAEKAEAHRIEKEAAEKTAIAQKATAAEEARLKKAAEAEANAPEIERLSMLINALEAKEVELRPPTTDEAAAKKFELEMAAVVQQDEAALEAQRKAHTETLLAVTKADAEKEAVNKLIKRIKGTNDCALGAGLKCIADRSKMVAVLDAQAVEAGRIGAAATIKASDLALEVSKARSQVEASRKVRLDHQVRMNDWRKACMDLSTARADLQALQSDTEGDDGNE